MDVLVGQGIGLGFHGRVAALAGAIGLECRDDVAIALPANAWYRIGRINILVKWNSVTAGAGIGNNLAFLRVATHFSLRWQNGQECK